jgi:endogenous inhibitor of DNA gyrase (YacG/DUF329 family)
MAERASETGLPICGKHAVEELRPFCSWRCANVDLGRRPTRQYRIPVMPDDAEDDTPAEST